MSKVHICNMALGFIGEAAIVSLEERSPQAEACRLYYSQALGQLLREHPWNFAQARVRLARMERPDLWEREYLYAYAYPPECVALQYLLTPEGEKSRRFIVSNIAGRRAVLANIPEALAAVTRYVDDTDSYDSQFTLALARALQRLIGKKLLKHSPGLSQEAEQLYKADLENARTGDAREGRPFQDASGHWDERNEDWLRAAADGVY